MTLLARKGLDRFLLFGDVGTPPVWVEGEFTAMASAPATVGGGGALVYTGGDFIYAFRGNGDSSFWRYSISNNSWSSMASAPSGVSSGSALVYTGGDFIYAFQGGGNSSFWRYSISNNSWSSMASAPAKVGGGGALVYTGPQPDRFLFAFIGNNTTNFLQLPLAPPKDVSRGDWQPWMK